MKIRKYARKPFDVEAIQVTEANMSRVAAWCGGQPRSEGPDDNPTLYIKVKVHRPLSERQTKAYVGDYVLLGASGYRVYTQSAFDKTFVPIAEDQDENQQTLFNVNVEFDRTPVTANDFEKVGAEN